MRQSSFTLGRLVGGCNPLPQPLDGRVLKHDDLAPRIALKVGYDLA